MFQKFYRILFHQITLLSHQNQSSKKPVNIDWFTESEPDPHVVRANALDRAFMIGRQNEDPKRGWSQFFQEKSTINPALTTVGYMPLIINPARDYDTLNTLILRCNSFI